MIMNSQRNSHAGQAVVTEGERRWKMKSCLLVKLQGILPSLCIEDNDFGGKPKVDLKPYLRLSWNGRHWRGLVDEQMKRCLDIRS